MDNFMIQGNEEDVISGLSKYMDVSSAKQVFHSLPDYEDFLEKDEVFEIDRGKDIQENSLGLVIPKTNYYINMKVTTIAFIGLLMDIQFTKGFTTFVLNTFGITAEAIRKLSDLEKCVLTLVKAGFVTAQEEEFVLVEPVLCVNYVRCCDCRKYDKCGLSRDSLSATVRELLKKNIIRQTADTLVCCF